MLFRSACTTFVAIMNRLARHIELLLHDNDCVILPGFGGFIAHDVPAYYVSEEGLYYPPSRNISFNSAITMNDGLLAQSYMNSYQVDYARAVYLIDMAIEQLRDTLDEEGIATLPHIGIIKQDIYQSLQFIPETAGIASPKHFGLGSFTIKELGQLTQSSLQVKEHQTPIITQTEKTINVHINKSIFRHVISTAAVLLLLLMISMPTGNHKPTDIASLQLTEMLATPIVQQNIPSMPQATELAEQESTTQETDIVQPEQNTALEVVAPKEPPMTETPAAVTREPIAAATQEAIAQQTEKQETATTEVVAEPIQVPAATVPTKTYHIIVASLPNHRGAEETLNSYLNKGYTQASLVERDDRVRISLTHFSNKDEANEYLKTLRENEKFQNAWLLAVRN